METKDKILIVEDDDTIAAFLVAVLNANGFDTIRESFLGSYRGAGEPEAVEKGACTNSMASGWQPIASHQINVTLQPGETKSYVFVLGYIGKDLQHQV